MTTRPLHNHPFLEGHWAPWHAEGEVNDVIVSQGEIPADLNGSLFRVGFNARYRQRSEGYYPIVGDGMLHSMHLENGKAFYKNRYVRTPRFLLEEKYGRAMFEYEHDFGDWRSDGCAQPIVDKPETRGVPAGSSNFTAWNHDGRLYALGEWGMPMEVDPKTLETLGAPDWSTALSAGVLPSVSDQDGCMGAHPKNCPINGEMFWFTRRVEEPRLIMQAYDPATKAIKTYPIDIPYTPWIHDWMLTENYIVMPCFPINIHMENLALGKGSKVWEPELGTRIAVIPRNGNGATIWLHTFDEGTRYSFHPQAAFEKDGHIICHVPEFPHFTVPAENNDMGSWSEMPQALMYEWDIDLAKATIKARQLDDRSIEFPMVDPRFVGREYRNGFNVCQVNKGPNMSLSYDGIIAYDMTTGQGDVHDFGTGSSAQEPIFVPRNAEAGEGDGYLMTYVHRPDSDRSDFVILDAANVDAEPVATIALPHRVPFCPHGSWMDSA